MKGEPCPKCGRKLKQVIDRFFTGEVKKIMRCAKCGYIKGDKNYE
jgi:uncharacterized Zn finger protein